MLTKCNATIVLTVILLTPLAAQAFPNWDIFNDAVIDEGDAYNIVNVYDTPPNRTTLTMLDGFADYIGARDSSVVNVFGGWARIVAWDHSRLTISGGDLSAAEAYEQAVVNFLDGAVSGNLIAGQFGTVNMLGGTVGWVNAGGSSVVNLYGGQITDSLGASGSSVVNIYGSAFAYDALGGPSSRGQITGLWLDGNDFAIDLYTPDTYSHINFVPEPATLLLLSVGGAIHRYCAHSPRTHARTGGDVC